MSPSRPAPAAIQVEFEFWFCCCGCCCCPKPPPKPPPAEPPKMLVSPPIVHVDDDAGAAAAAREGPPNPFPRLPPAAAAAAAAAGRAAPAEGPSSSGFGRSLLRIIFGTTSPAPPPGAREFPPPCSRAMTWPPRFFFVGYRPSASSCALPLPAVVHFPVGISFVMCRRCGGGVAFPLSLLLLQLLLLFCWYD